MIQKNIYRLFLIMFVNVLLISTVYAADVPFEVVKTKVQTQTTVATPEGIVAVVSSGTAYGDDSIGVDKNGNSLGYPPAEGTYDHRVKVPIEGVTYKLEFWNVGQMGGEKGFFFKSDYGDAKLTIMYQVGQAYKMVGTGESLGQFQMQEKKDVNNPDIKRMEYDLTFSGGPWGIFTYKQKDGSVLQIGRVVNGNRVELETAPEPGFLLYADKASLPITNSSAFEKWLEMLNGDEMGCSEPGNSSKDSGIRFSDYSGEVMVRPCDDEDAWYGAELDMVLHKDDHVKTGDDSMAVLSLSDMTTFVMKPEAELILSSPPDKQSSIKLIWGKIKTNFKQMMKDGTMDVEMSQATAGIKGTILITEETGSESTLKVIEGTVAFTSKTTGKTEMVGQGEMITATKEGLGKKKEFAIEQEEATWEAEALTEDDAQDQKNDSNSLVYVFVAIVIASIGSILLYRRRKKPEMNTDAQPSEEPPLDLE